MLEGKTIKKIRPMSVEELAAEGWEDSTTSILIELTDGTLIYPSSDSEGNSPGALFGTNEKDGAFALGSAPDFEEQIEAAFVTYQEAEKAYKAAKSIGEKFDALEEMAMIEDGWTEVGTEKLREKHNGDIKKMHDELKAGHDFMYQMSKWGD